MCFLLICLRNTINFAGVYNMLWDTSNPDSDKPHQAGPHNTPSWGFCQPQNTDHITTGTVQVSVYEHNIQIIKIFYVYQSIWI